MKLSKKEQTFVKSQGVARLATVGRENMPHNVPVCPVMVDGKTYVASEKDATKVKNIKAHPAATITFDVYQDSWKGLRCVMLQCRCRIVDQKVFKKIRTKLYAKYPKYETDAALDPADSVIIELLPQKKFSWGL